MAIDYDIEETIAVLSTANSGWTKELNKVSWNGAESKYDIREWSPNRERIGKGITLTQEEMEVLVNQFI